MLNPGSPLPLYRQLASELLAKIRKGEYAAGQRIPSEPELAAHYRIGRPTARQATELLLRWGVVKRRRGSGTFVSEDTPDVDLFTLGGTLSAFERGGIKPKTRLVAPLRRIAVDPDRHNPFAEKSAYTYTRLSIEESHPLLLEEFFIDPEVFPRLEQHGVSGRSLAELVAERYHMKPSSGRQQFLVAPATDEQAEWLGVERDARLLAIRRWLCFPNAPDAIYVVMHLRTDRVVFTQTLRGFTDA
jgi:GntR family transcriptional regulator